MNRYVEWLNRNSHIAFPFVEDTDFSCVDGSTLPNFVLLDARACLMGSRNSSMHVASVRISDDGVAEFTVSALGYDVTVTADDGLAVYSDDNMSIRLIVAKPGVLSSARGEYVLSKPAEILQSRIMSIPYGIGIDTLTCGTVSGTGRIRVRDGYNTELFIRNNELHLRVGDGLGKGQKCPPSTEDVGTCNGRALRFLNGQKADSDGSISLIGGDGVAITSGDYQGIPAVIVTTAATVNQFLYRAGT